MLPIIFAAKFLQLLPHLLHSDNDRHDPEEIFCQIQEILQDHADHYLSVEDAVTVGEILLQKLSEAFSSL